MPINKHDFRKVKTSFCFLDETGLIYSKRDKFFALGVLKCERPEKLYDKIRKIRQKYNYNEELKWSNIDRFIRFEIARRVFDVFLKEKAEFYCLILNKDELDFEKHYNNDLNKVYRNFTIVLLKLIIGKKPSEILIVLADDYFMPEGINLEETIKKFVNDHYKKFVVAGVCQIDSKSSHLLQLSDLILGSIIYDLKKQEGLIQRQNKFKRRFLNFVYQKLEVKKGFFVHNKKGTKIKNYVSPKILRKDYFIRRGKIKAFIFDVEKSANPKNTNKKQAMTHNG